MQCIVDGCSGGHFYPRPPRGGRRVQRASSAHKHNFYPRPPRGGRPDHSSGHRHNDFISIHALREEGDRCNLSVVYSSTIFLSTPSARRATLQCIVDGCSGGHFYPRPPRGGRPLQVSAASRFGFYFYPRPPRGGRPGQHGGAVRDHDISIHALREEGDRRRSPAGWWAGYFYPRPPRGGRQLVFVELGGVFPFLSTPSARRATCRRRRCP